MPTLVQYMASLAFALVLVAPPSVLALGNINVGAYWGQNAFGATHLNDTADWQKTLSFYCQDDGLDVLSMAYLDVAFDVENLPSLNFANTCNVGTAFPGTDLPNCTFLASDINECQAKGKVVTLSIAGAISVALASDSQAEQFADTIWNLFLGGSSSLRPFGDAILDGVDLDLEGGSELYWPTFVNQIRSYSNGASKRYYITASPQCPFPDANLGSLINAVGFDAVYVQFYNNYCGLQAFDNSNGWNFAEWDNWAKTISPNQDVTVYIGAPADPLAATTGYVEVDTLASYALQTSEEFSSFGGVMLWDASYAYENGNFAASLKSALSAG